MDQRSQLLPLLTFIKIFVAAAGTDQIDATALLALRGSWKNVPSTWVGSDPCSGWMGITCNNSRVTNITLAGINLTGQLSGDIGSLSELQTLDLSSNNLLTGPLPSKIGNLKKLWFLCLTGCGFTGPIPDTIGSLLQLSFLALDSNRFNGKIPNSIGNLSNLSYFDVTNNHLEGPIPVSNGTVPGMDMLLQARHFHLGTNQLSGTIPPQLFSSNMVLIHVLLNNNNLSGNIPSTLKLVQSLEVIRLDGNSLSGSVPTNISSLTNLSELSLSNNNLTGAKPNLNAMNLNYLDLSNNSFDVSDVPSWISSLTSLTTLMMERTQLEGKIPVDLFSLPSLQIVKLSNNQLNGNLNISSTSINVLQDIDLQNNSIEGFNPIPGGNNITILLEGNPVCENTDVVGKKYCNLSLSNSSNSESQSCGPESCSSGQVASPNCTGAYTYKGTLYLLSNVVLGNATYYKTLAEAIRHMLTSYELPVDSVSVSNPTMGLSGYLELSLDIFPPNGSCFNTTGSSMIGYVLNVGRMNASSVIGPYSFTNYAQNPSGGANIRGIIIGVAVGGSILLLSLVLLGGYALHQKKRAERAIKQNNPFANWGLNMESGDVPQINGVRRFSFQELKKCTENFAEANIIGSGGYGKVYRGTLTTGQQVAIKRAQTDSMQGAHEFKTEIELLSRVHHKNLLILLGFCYEQAEQMLIYEYIPNGTIMDNLSGKSGIRLDWTRRLQVALGAARGLVYLHEHANPPIIHRDIKSNNILLDEDLNAKVADFGLSKLKNDTKTDHVSTEVKGTLGYLDPEYYMTQQLTEKSDVYSFGVVMLELITAKRPIVRGKYIVREVKNAMDNTKDLYNLHEILDPTIDLGTTLRGFEQFVDLAMSCVEESGDRRPTMGEVVKEIENIMQFSGLKANADSVSTSATYDEAGEGRFQHPYNDDGFYYSGTFTPFMVEPK